MPLIAIGDHNRHTWCCYVYAVQKIILDNMVGVDFGEGQQAAAPNTEALMLSDKLYDDMLCW